MPESKGLLDVVRDINAKDGKDGIWKWCMAPAHAHGKAKRFNVAARFARNQRDNSQGEVRKGWADARRTYAKQREHWEGEYDEQHSDAEWPDSLTIAECLYETPNNHFHLASPERDKLIVVAGIVAEQFKCRIGEFPPFDATENVHTGISWHYRDPSRPYVGIPYNGAHLGLHGDWGCAMDVNDLDGGGDQEYAAYIEVRRRYL